MKLLLLVPLLLLAACSTPVVKTIIQTVEIPVAIKCSVEHPLQPQLTFPMLTIADNLFSKVKALLVDRELTNAYNIELEAALKTCTF